MNKEWSSYDDAVLVDFLFESNISNREMAVQLGTTEAEIKAQIRSLGLGWVRRQRGFASRGQAALTQMMRKLLPNEEIRTEEPLPDRLRLDVYCPRYKLAVEYHGRQHFSYVEHFHGDLDGFRESQFRDEKKIKYCQDLGIALVVFRYDDLLTEDVVFSRLLDALRTTPTVKEEKPTIKGDPYYEAYKQRQREYRRKSYQRMKRDNAARRNH